MQTTARFTKEAELVQEIVIVLMLMLNLQVTVEVVLMTNLG